MSDHAQQSATSPQDPLLHNLGRVRLGENLLDFQRRLLEVGGTVVNMRAKAMEVLGLLVLHHDRVVTRAEFIARVWEGNELTGNRGITDTIWEIRQSLHDGNILIETIPKQGYRLTVLPEPLSLPEPERSAGQSRSRGTIKWVALTVLLLVAAWAFRLMDRRGPVGPGEPAKVGVRATSVTSLPGVESMPDLAPDGRRLVFVWDHGDLTTEICIASLLEDEPRTTLFKSPRTKRFPTWSPDGNRIAFLEERDRTWRLHLLDVSSHQDRPIATSAIFERSGLCWTNRGLVFTVRREDAWALICLDFNTLRETPLTPAAERTLDFAARFAGDGERFAFIRGNMADQTRQLYAMSISPQGGAARRLAEGFDDILAVTWLNSEEIAFVSRSDNAIRAVNFASGEVRLILESSDLDLTELCALPDGALLTGRKKESAHLEVIDLDRPGRPARVFVDSLGEDLAPQYSPKRDALVFASSRTGMQALWTVAAEGGNPNLLLETDEHVWKPTWSPDQREVAYIKLGKNSKQYEVWSLDLATGFESKWSDDDYQYAGVPSWAADGAAILVGRTRTLAKWSIVRMDRQGRTEDLEINAFFAQPSADGLFLYYVPLDRHGLWRYRLADGEAEIVIDRPVLYTQWLLSESEIYFFTADTSPNKLGIYDQDNGTIRFLDTPDLRPVLNDTIALDVARKRLIYAAKHTLERDLVRLETGE